MHRIKYVYFIKELALGSIKIGVSRNVEERLAVLQRGMPQKLECIGFIKGDFKDENLLHDKFSHLRIRGEWFKADDELLDFLAKSDLKSIEPRKRIKPSTYLFNNSNRIILSTKNL